MKSSPQVPPEQLVEVMKDEVEQYVKEVMKAVNEAKDGEWIAGSEEPVRNLSAELRRRIFKRAIQQRVDAAEAAFPPSAPSADRKAVGQYTDAEKVKRRNTIKAKRRRCGKKRKPLQPRKKGADQAWKEFKVAYFYSEDMLHQHMAFTHRNHVAAGKLLRREADRLRFRQATERLAVVDGAVWIREQMQLHLAELDGLGLDFFHLSENVHRARRKVFGEKDPAGSTWADELMHVFKHDGYSAAWERLVQWRAGVKGSKKRAAADLLLNYVSNRKEMIRYPAFRAKGWQIGSGPTESQCKLCTKRLKGHGRRWDRINATAVAALDTLDRSSQWAKFWPEAYPAAL